jgi:hypothetical protein
LGGGGGQGRTTNWCVYVCIYEYLYICIDIYSCGDIYHYPHVNINTTYICIYMCIRICTYMYGLGGGGGQGRTTDRCVYVYVYVCIYMYGVLLKRSV